jgi:hypothetical protein
VAEKNTGAATTAPKPTSSTPIPQPDHDRVVMASRLPDGKPAQTPDFEFIGPKDAAVDAAKRQLSEQAVSAADVAIRGVTSEPEEGQEGVGTTGNDPTTAELRKVHDSAAKAAEAKAESEVNANHKGLGDNR